MMVEFKNKIDNIRISGKTKLIGMIYGKRVQWIL